MLVKKREFYRVQNTVVIFAFKRVDTIISLLLALSEFHFSKIILVCDGPVENDEISAQKCAAVREALSSHPWGCEVESRFSNINLGCKNSFVSNLNEIFAVEKAAIVLEDDTIPNEEFFRHCDYCLARYEENLDIGIVLGSNLIDEGGGLPGYAYSKIMSPWGWASWARVWQQFDPEVPLKTVLGNSEKYCVGSSAGIVEKIYWRELFTHAVKSQTTWALLLQRHLFDRELLAVYPHSNLIKNIGFNSESTHTKGKVPKYVSDSEPTEQVVSQKLAKANFPVLTDPVRDKLLISTVWHFDLYHVIRLFLGNLYRYKIKNIYIPRG